MKENKSFMKMSENLLAKGIKNYNFMNKLYNEKLKYVDPFDEKLNIRTKQDIITECKKNIWYFLKIIKIPEPTYDENIFKYIDFELNMQNCAMIYLAENNKTVYNNSAAHSYKTYSSLIYLIYSAFKEKYVRIILESELAKDLFITATERMIKSLPEYIQIGINLDEYVNNKNEKNISILFVDEFSRIENNKKIIEDYNKGNYQLIITSVNTNSGEPAKVAKDFCESILVSKFENQMYDERMSMLSTNIRVSFNYMDVGDLKVLGLITQNYMENRDAINREMFCEWR